MDATPHLKKTIQAYLAQRAMEDIHKPFNK